MQKVYLLDTNIISEFAKQVSNPTVVSLYNERCDLCAMAATTWQELMYGLKRMPDGKRKNYVEKCLMAYKDEVAILPYDDFAANICGTLLANAEKKGKSISVLDCQIAATAIANGMILVTRNVSDFKEAAENSFLQIENWFSE